MSKKDEIIDAASYFFSEKGYELSMADIAGEVGIKTPSLYSHFESKDEIISIVIEKEVFKLYDFLNQIIDQAEGKSMELILKQLYQSVFNYFDIPGKLEFCRRIPLMDNQLIKEKSKEIIREQDQSFTIKLKKVIENGISRGEIRENYSHGDLLIYLTMIQGLLDLKLFRKATSAEMEEFILVTWDAYWNAIKISK